MQEVYLQLSITYFQVGILSVVEAPDILYNETSNDTIVAEGASVHLKCEARGYPEPTVSWKRGNKMPIVLRDGKGTTRGKSLSEYPRNIIDITVDRYWKIELQAYAITLC